MSRPFKVGDFVRTKHVYWKSRRWGHIERINGGYIYVRLRYKNVLIEVYDVEISRK